MEKKIKKLMFLEPLKEKSNIQRYAIQSLSSNIYKFIY